MAQVRENEDCVRERRCLHHVNLRPSPRMALLLVTLVVYLQPAASYAGGIHSLRGQHHGHHGRHSHLSAIASTSTVDEAVQTETESEETASIEDSSADATATDASTSTDEAVTTEADSNVADTSSEETTDSDASAPTTAEEIQADKKDNNNPLYEDFLFVLSVAGEHALKQKQVAKPSFDNFLKELNAGAEKAQKGNKRYDDFLRIMNEGAEKAYKQQAGSKSFDEFLNIMKKEADQAYHEQVELPSYSDFLTALKESSVQALLKPKKPKYDEFLDSLKGAAEMAMQERVFKGLSKETLQALKAHHQHTQNQNPLDQIHKGMKKVGDKITGKEEKKEQKHEHHEESRLQRELRELQARKAHADKTGAPAHAKKPLMKRINVLRTQLCWKRPNLWEHEKCMRFLGLKCMQESTGEGICKAFTKKADEKCKTAPEDAKFKDDYCALAEALADDKDEEDEDEEAEDAEEVQQEAEAEEGEDGADVGSDEDLDKEMEDIDKELMGDEAAKGAAAGAKAGDAAAGKAANASKKVMDSDGEGVTDDKDAYPQDAHEWADPDKDGIGDNADTDRDGDGHPNSEDAFPDNKDEWGDLDKDQVGNKADKDRDGDGIPNDKDTFPDDPTEWKDSDKDGVGDNKDAFPYNPNCHSQHEPCNNFNGSRPFKKNSVEDPQTLDMDEDRLLPAQGYNEAMNGAPVNHNNYYTWVSDWQDEFPEMPESEKNTMGRICQEHPTNIWCRRFKHHDAHFR